MPSTTNTASRLEQLKKTCHITEDEQRVPACQRKGGADEAGKDSGGRRKGESNLRLAPGRPNSELSGRAKPHELQPRLPFLPPTITALVPRSLSTLRPAARSPGPVLVVAVKQMLRIWVIVCCLRVVPWVRRSPASLTHASCLPPPTGLPIVIPLHTVIYISHSSTSTLFPSKTFGSCGPVGGVLPCSRICYVSRH